MLCHRKAVRLKRRKKKKRRTAEEREEETGMTSQVVVGVFLDSVDRLYYCSRLVVVGRTPLDLLKASFSLVESHSSPVWWTPCGIGTLSVSNLSQMD
jgi:hypothetical protein